MTSLLQLKKLVKEYMLLMKMKRMQVVLGKILLQNKKTISTAESCTGGAIASLITSVPGSSAYYEGSIVSYSNDVKESLLNVKKKHLKNYGAVSEETVRKC